MPIKKGVVLYFCPNPSHGPTTKGVLYICALTKALPHRAFFSILELTITKGLPQWVFSPLCQTSHKGCLFFPHPKKGHPQSLSSVFSLSITIGQPQSVFSPFCPNTNQRKTTKVVFLYLALTLTKGLPQRLLFSNFALTLTKGLPQKGAYLTINKGLPQSVLFCIFAVNPKHRPTSKMSLSRNRYRVYSSTHRRAIKEESKVANRNWVDYQACSLLQYINVIANLFKLGNYFNELRRKIIRANNLFQFIHQVTIEFRFQKSLTQGKFKSNFRYFVIWILRL